MLLTPHTLVGIAVGASIGNPFLAVPLSFALHFLGDMVPHWDFYSNTSKEERVRGWRPLAVMLDLALAVSLGTTFTLYALWVEKNPLMAVNIFLSGIASVLPDALTGPYIYGRDKINVVSRFIHSIQHKLQFQAPLPWGAITQIIIVLFSLLLTTSSLAQ